ncbi:hypothetical protein MLPM_0070 [Mycobacterium lepromatosis]|uniref:Uncharacterized protein n=1 Tax=Mycobacterium lepromatosis TaxID=480418 RepID=A0A0F4ETF9_9MYCO|nr:hypothetical protein MLPM_0070 [Mycobacterium lepromatosis]
MLHGLASLLVPTVRLVATARQHAVEADPVAIGVKAAVALATASVGMSQILRRRRTKAEIAGRPPGAD